MTKRPVTLAFLAAALGGTLLSSFAAEAAPKSAAKPSVKPPPPDYFPLRVNDWWKFQTTTGEGKQSNFTMKVISAEKQPDQTVIFKVDTQSTKPIHDWYTKPAGLVLRHKEQFGDDEKMLFSYEPVYSYLKNPLSKDDAWEWKGKGMMGVDISENAQVTGPEDIFVPAGKFSTMKVTTQVTQGGANMTKTYWFANHIGLIKSATQSGPVGSVTELVDYSFKPKPKIK
ncbi:MAG: hypothetical protein U0105_24785 [Candidatus Obscuribacterales bacterium]